MNFPYTTLTFMNWSGEIQQQVVSAMMESRELRRRKVYPGMIPHCSRQLTVISSFIFMLLLSSMIRPSCSFMFSTNRFYPLAKVPQLEYTASGKSKATICITRISRVATTQCWGKYGRNTPRRTRIDKDDILSYERSLITDRGYSYILGSDETGRGSIAGPVITATCCILTLTDNESDGIIDASDLPTVGQETLSDQTNDKDSQNKSLIKDSKQLHPKERERIYETILRNPEVYSFSVAQRSNNEIDDTGNILSSTMDAFQESIEDLAQNNLFPYILSRQNPIRNDTPNVIPADWQDCGCYSIVDGKKSPKISTVPSFPCRPMVNADKQVYTVALASIIAKVTLDRMFLKWHKEYPNYGFDQNKGYATKDHIEAIHKYGPCPLHRMTFKSLKGR